MVATASMTMAHRHHFRTSFHEYRNHSVKLTPPKAQAASTTICVGVIRFKILRIDMPGPLSAA